MAQQDQFPVQRKVVRDGHVAVIVAPGFGSGWYSWNSDRDGAESLLFDPELVAAVEAGDQQRVVDRAKELCPEAYLGSNAKELTIEMVPVGEQFLISEFDGYEELIRPGKGGDWVVA